MKPLLIGQAPGPNTDPEQPLSGRCGARLAEMCGVDLPTFLRTFERVNLVRKHPGKAGKGDAFPMDAARKTAIDLLLFGKLNRTVVVLGGKVAKAFGFPSTGLEFFRWNQIDGSPLIRLAFAPHPSGISLWWNDPKNAAAARRFWRRLATEAAPDPAASRRRPSS